MTTPIVVTPPSRYEAQWAVRAQDMPHLAPAAALGLTPGDTVVVIVAHPDDETFGLGAALATLAGAGIGVHVVALSAGEAALDHVGRSFPGLGQRRRDEFAQACKALAVSSSHVVGLPDGQLSARRTEVAAAVKAAVEHRSPQRLLTTWWRDPHTDHEAVGRAVMEEANRRGLGAYGFPIWAPHWSEPDTLNAEADAACVMRTDGAARQARRAATRCYLSQTQPLSAELAPVLPPSIVRWGIEIAIKA